MVATLTPSKKSPPAPRKWARRADARPEEILDAALAEFTERGFDAARIEDVARRAGISKGGIYLYFESKQALLKALIEAKVAPIARQVEALARSGGADPLGAMRLLAGLAAARIADPKIIAVPRLVIGLSGRFPEIADFYRTQVVEKARAALERLVESAMARGQFRRADPRAVVRAFIGPLFFEAMWAHVLKGESALTAPEKLIESQFDILLNGLEPRA